MHAEHGHGLSARDAQRLGLRVAAVQHPLGHRLGHLAQQGVALVLGHLARGHEPAEQDLDVHLVVRAVDPGDVVDRVGVDPPAVPGRATADRVLDPTALGEAEVAALADHPAAQGLGVDANRVV